MLTRSTLVLVVFAIQILFGQQLLSSIDTSSDGAKRMMLENSKAFETCAARVIQSEKLEGF